MADEGQVRAFTALLSAANLLQRAVDQDLRSSAGITHAQFEILANLDLADEGMRMTDLARGLVLSRSGATYRIHQLVDAGLVERTQDPQDDRIVLVRLTAKGRDTVAVAMPPHTALVQRLMFDVIERDDLDLFTAQLDTIAERVSQAGRA